MYPPGVGRFNLRFGDYGTFCKFIVMAYGRLSWPATVQWIWPQNISRVNRASDLGCQACGSLTQRYRVTRIALPIRVHQVPQMTRPSERPEQADEGLPHFLIPECVHDWVDSAVAVVHPLHEVHELVDARWARKTLGAVEEEHVENEEREPANEEETGNED